MITAFYRRVAQVSGSWYALGAAIASALVFFAGFQLLGAAVTYSVSVDKTLVKGGSTQTYSFTVINGSSDSPIYNIKITKPTGFTVSATGITCPTNFGVNTDSLAGSGFIECLGDPDPSFNARLLAGATGTVILSATAPASDSTAPWVVVTKDTAFASRSTNLVSEVDATTPTVTSSTLLTPNGGYVKGGADYDITWSGITDPHITETPITLEYSAAGDFSDTVVVIATGIANSGTYSWTVPTANLSTAQVRITAVDSVGNSASDISDSAFVIDSGAPAVNAGPDVLTKAQITQNATVTDTNLGTYLWEKRSGTGDITFGTATAEDTTISASADGTYTIRLTATDAAGNVGFDEMVLTWDATVPIVDLSSSDTDLIVKDADMVVITATFSEPMTMTASPTITIGSLVTGVTMSGSGTTWTYTWDVPTENDGNVEVSVAGTDLATNAYGGATTLTFTIDNIAPDAPIVSAPSGVVTVNSATYTISGTAEANALVQVYNGTTMVGSQQLSGGATSYSVSANLAQNDVNNFTVTATDTAGNEGSSTSVSAITEDSTPPAIATYTVSNTVISPTVSTGTQDSTSIDVAFSETAAYTVKVKQGGTVIKTLQTTSTALDPDPKTWDGTNTSAVQVSDGQYTIEIIMTDAAGNPTTDTSVTVTVDNTAPTIGTLVPNDASYTEDNTPLISATLSDGTGSGINEGSIVMTVDGDPVTADYVDGVVLYIPESPLLDEEHTITVDVKDNGGTSAVPPAAEWSFTVDTTDPIIGIDPVTTPTNQTTQTINGTFTETNILSIVVGGVTATIGVGTYSAPVSLAEGSDIIVVVATDLAGSTAQTATLVVRDTTNPTVNAGSDKRDRTTVNQDATVSDATALTYLWTQQSGTGTITFGSATSVDTTIASDTNGIFVIRLTATDAAGNSAYDEMTLTWDTTAPTVTLTKDHADLIVRDADTVVISAAFSEEMQSAPTISINSVGLVSAAPMTNTTGNVWTYSWDVPSGNDGNHTATVAGTDLAGNAYVVADSIVFTIDNIAPTASEVTPVSTPTNDITPNVVINVENGAGWVIKNGATELASGTGTGASQTATLSAIVEGSYELTLVATDTAGNVTSTPLSTFIVDTTVPTITSRTPAVGASGVSPSADITVTFSEAVTIATGNISFDPTVTGAPVVTFSTETNIATIDPASDFANNATYTVTLTGVTDTAGNALGTTSWQFSTATGYSITLRNNEGNGWNFVSLPTIPSSTAIADVLGSASANIDSVWTYDAATQSWSAYYPNGESGLSSLSTMTAGYGYWIKYTGSSPATLSGSGNLLTSGGNSPSTPPSRSLPAGWNLVGYYQAPGTTSVSKSTAFQSVDGLYTNVLGFNNTNKVYVLNSSISTVNPGEAFWLLMQSSGVYSF